MESKLGCSSLILDPLRTEIRRRNPAHESPHRSLRACLSKSNPTTPPGSQESLDDPLTLTPKSSAKSRAKRSRFKTVHTSKNSPANLKQVVGVQELDVRGPRRPAAPSSAVWSLEFSPDGKYMATGGQDGLLRIWSALDAAERRASASGPFNELPLFAEEPLRVLEGHTDEILDLKWSKNNFILTTSLDGTVRLWHCQRAKCLTVFHPSDIVTSVAFHPTDDRFFLAGSLNRQLSLWSVLERQVAYTRKMPDMVTAVAFTADGLNCLAGCYNGKLVYCKTDNLKILRSAQVGNPLKPKGTLKITGVVAVTLAGCSTCALVTSNSSRVRLYNLQDLSLERRFRGARNNYSQSAAALSDDGELIICGSEDHRSYIWNVHSPAEGLNRQVLQNEYVHSNHAAVSVAQFVPQSTLEHAGVTSGRAFVSADNDGVIPVYIQSPERQIGAQVKGTLMAAPVLFMTYGKFMGRAAAHALLIGSLI